MERGEIECQVISVSDSSEMDFSDEIEEEFSAVMEDVKSEFDIKPVVSPEIFEEYLQYCEVSLELRCRLCALPDNDMVYIFNSDKTEQSIIEKIERCLPIVVRETDPLSKHACRSCLASLELCYQFHKTVTKAEQQLLALERTTKDPINPELPTRSDNKRPLEQSSDVETSSKKRRTLVVQNNFESVDLESRSTNSNKPRTLVAQNNFESVDLESRSTNSNKPRTLVAQNNFESVDLESRSTNSNKPRTLVAQNNFESVDLESRSTNSNKPRTLVAQNNFESVDLESRSTNSNKPRTLVAQNNFESVDLESRSTNSNKPRTLVAQNNFESVDLESRSTNSNKPRTLVAQNNFESVDLESRSTNSNKPRTLVVQNNVELVDLESRSPPLCDARTLGNNNSNKKSSRHSSNAKSSMGTTTSILNLENTCDLEVLEVAESTILRRQPRRKVKHNPVEPEIQEANNAYGCDFCPEKFNSKRRLVVHRKIHFRKIPYSLKLSAGEKTSSRRTSRGQAPANDSETNYYNYSVCNELSNSPSSVTSPTVATKSSQKWQCATCRELFWKIGDLNTHLKSCKWENPSP